MSRPRLLFLCQTTPFPPDGGVWIRTYHVLRLLSEAFRVTALFFERPPQARRVGDAESMRELERFAEVEIFPLVYGRSRLRRILDHALSLLSFRVYTVFKHRSRRLSRRLRQLLATQRFDLVHLDSLDLSGYLPLLEGLPIVVVHHNVESELLRRRADQERSAPVSWLVNHQARLQEKEERRWCGRVTLNVMVSERDRQLLEAAVTGVSTAVVPNGVDTDYFRPMHDGSHGLVFVGSLGWYPNRDALEFFAADILPRIRRSHPELSVHWIGRATDAEIRRYRSGYGIELTDYVEDIRPLVRPAACYIVPLRVGGGTRLKILDAWAMGKAVVSTAVGCEGLEAQDGKNIIIADDSEAFAEAVTAVLAEPELRERLGRGGRRTAEAVYSWDAIGRRMVDIYKDVSQ